MKIIELFSLNPLTRYAEYGSMNVQAEKSAKNDEEGTRMKSNKQHPFTLEEILGHHNVDRASPGAGEVHALPGGRTAMLVKHTSTICGTQHWLSHVSGDPITVLRDVGINPA
jgi:hypothetical protein